MVTNADNSNLTGNLPTSLSSFIGRKQEIAEVKRLLSEYRLLTLTGPGGCGKTRLALRVAEELRSPYRDGVWLVEFASLADGELVPQALAAVLGVREQAGQSLSESLASYLRARDSLLLLDNCEHLVEACARLAATLLAACPGVRLLATSREPLGVPGEGVWVVPPLSLPAAQPWRGPADAQASLALYEQSEAIQLFVARARAAKPSFELTVVNSSWVAEICRRMDGIPLAIELAAARAHAYSARQIAEHLDDRFQLLTSRLRTVPQRHQTLEATLDWSHDLLSVQEQEAFRRLSVFASGWTLEAAQAICADDALGATEVMDVLSNLVDKSLVVAESFLDSRRYHYLETIRQYAHRKLAAAGEVEATQMRHAAYFLRWAEESAPHLYGTGQSEWLARFDAEHDNLRAALDWSLAAGGAEQEGLRLAAACWKYWRVRGYYSEGRERLLALLGRESAEGRTGPRAWALLRASNLAYVQSDFPAVRPLAEEALAIFRELGQEVSEGAGLALDILAELATEVGDYDTADRLFEEALAIFQEIKNEFGTAEMHMQLGWSAMRAGDYERAEVLLNQSLPAIRRLDDRHPLGLNLSGLGELAIRQRQLARANEFLEESLVVRREIDERWGIAASLGSLGWVALLQRDFDRMRDYLRQSLEIRQSLGDQGGIAWCLEKLAEAVILQAKILPPAQNRRMLLRAARLFGAAAALRGPIYSVIDPADQPEYERALEALREALGQEAFDDAWREGARLSLQQAIDAALSPVVSPDKAAAPAGSEVARVKYGGLSPRERETAMWIAQGKSNREIAAAMTVGEKTVETYVTRILNKLGFDSRVQIATWAVEKGLSEVRE
jgi:non-specific serine/threonine protein kinase